MKHAILKNARTKFLLVALFAIMAVFVFRLAYLQIFRHDFYVDQANQLQITKFTIAPERGLIYARDGQSVVPLVLNESVFTVFADPLEVKDPSKVESVVRRVAGGNMVEGFESQLTNKRLRYVVMARQVSRQQAELIRKQDLPGVGLQAGSRRVYPEGQLASQLLGYVNNDGQGQYGLEGALQQRLVGTPGKLEAVTDVRRIPLTIGGKDTRVPAQHGDNLVLTIDRAIQSKVEQVLKSGLEKVNATKGSVVALDPLSGAVMGMANLPTYNPAEYTKVTDYAVFQNGVVSAPYEAGSVIKTLTMAAGIDSGAVAADGTFNNVGYVKVDDRTIKNTLMSANNPRTTMTQVFEFSLNTGVVHILQQMGGGEVNRQARDTLYSYFHDRFKLGQGTGIEQAGELPGTVIAPSEEQGNNVRYANMSFGQGMDVTMIQVASAFAAIVNGGTLYQPHLVGGTMQDDGNVKWGTPSAIGSSVIKPEVSSSLRTMLQEARRRGPMGGSDPAGYVVGGKTGSSQIIDPKTGEYRDDISIGTYLGFGGVSTPEYVIMVRVDDAKISGYSGSVAAGPIFNELSNWLIEYLQQKPSN